MKKAMPYGICKCGFCFEAVKSDRGLKCFICDEELMVRGIGIISDQGSFIIGEDLERSIKNNQLKGGVKK